MIDTVRFRHSHGQNVPPAFKTWAQSNLDDGEYSWAYDIIAARILFRLHDRNKVCDGFVNEEDL